MFNKWFKRKYIEWRGEETEQKYSVEAFGRYLGLTQQTVDSYMRKTTPTDKDIINLLARTFGSEIYDAIGFDLKPDQRFIADYKSLPEEAIPELQKTIRELRAKYKTRQSPHKEIS